MKIIAVVPVVAILWTATVYASCEGSKTLFFCNTVKGKQIEVCDAGDTINYAFGKARQTPEIAIKVPRDKASTYQWAGVGRSESYAVDIPNGKTTYNVFWGVDRMTDEHAIEAGVNVLINNKLVTTVKCAEKDLVSNIEGVDLKPTE
ncbi:MAG: hypothetical protein Q8Q54_14260 [Methylococcales bacterium]|nr:hypothetical protein [Methylococcales bacterium]MDP3840077.1 hypothetical protein [Methylococcales bacterium]